MSKKTYLAIIHKKKNSDYGVSFPDFPGCISVGSTLDEAKDMAEEALQFHVDGMIDDNNELPFPTSLESNLQENAVAYFLVTVRVPEKKSVRINITFSPDILENIDGDAKRKGMSRSKWLSKAADSFLKA